MQVLTTHFVQYLIPYSITLDNLLQDSLMRRVARRMIRLDVTVHVGGRRLLQD